MTKTTTKTYRLQGEIYLRAETDATSKEAQAKQRD